MRRLLLPTASTESAFADVAVFSVVTMSFTTVAELIARLPPACAPAHGRLNLVVSRETTMSADTPALGDWRLDT